MEKSRKEGPDLHEKKCEVGRECVKHFFKKREREMLGIWVSKCEIGIQSLKILSMYAYLREPKIGLIQHKTSIRVCQHEKDIQVFNIKHI